MNTVTEAITTTSLYRVQWFDVNVSYQAGNVSLPFRFYEILC